MLKIVNHAGKWVESQVDPDDYRSNPGLTPKQWEDDYHDPGYNAQVDDIVSSMYGELIDVIERYLLELVKSGITNVDPQSKNELLNAIRLVGADSISSHPDVVKLIALLMREGEPPPATTV